MNTAQDGGVGLGGQERTPPVFPIELLHIYEYTLKPFDH